MLFFHIGIALIVTVLWGLNFVAIKLALQEMSPFMLGAFRYIVASLPILVGVVKPSLSWKKIILIGFVGGFIMFAFLFLSIKTGCTAGLASLLLQSQAFFSILFAKWFLKERILPWQWLSILLGSLGIFYISKKMNTDTSLLGFICVLIAALAWASTNILHKQLKNFQAFELIVWTSIVPIIPFLLLSIIIDGYENIIITINNLSYTGICCILYIGFIATLGCAALWTYLIYLYSPAVVAPYSLLIPLFGISFTCIICNEKLSCELIYSCIFIFSGLIINQLALKGYCKKDQQKGAI